MTIVFESVRRFLDIPRRLTQIQLTLRQLENNMSDLGTQLDQTLSDLGQAIDELATRVSNLPPAGEIQQADLDAIKGFTDRIKGLAQAAPTIPIPGSPEPEVPPVTDTPIDETTPDDGATDEAPAKDDADK